MEYQGAVFMSKKDQINFSITEDFRAGRLSRKDASLKMDKSERTITRKAKKIREHGIKGIKHGNTGKLPWNKIDEKLILQYVELYKTRYSRFNFSHAMEMIKLHHDMDKISYTTFRNACRKEGLGKVKKRRSSKSRIARERYAQEGYLWQMDGSPEKWNLSDKWSLIALIDDATSKVPNAAFEKTETTWGCMRVVMDAILKNGIPEFILTDRAGWSARFGKRHHFSQFVRACNELGITVISTPSAEAKGRIERLNRTFQDRLIPELDLYGITGQKDSNRYLGQCFIPDWNQRFTVEAKSETTRYRPVPVDVDLGEIFCLKYNRIVNKDHTISFENKVYRLDPGKFGTLKRKEVIIHQYEHGQVSVFYGKERVINKLFERPKPRWMKGA